MIPAKGLTGYNHDFMSSSPHSQKLHIVIMIDACPEFLRPADEGEDSFCQFVRYQQSIVGRITKRCIENLACRSSPLVVHIGILRAGHVVWV